MVNDVTVYKCKADQKVLNKSCGNDRNVVSFPMTLPVGIPQIRGYASWGRKKKPRKENSEVLKSLHDLQLLNVNRVTTYTSNSIAANLMW